MEKDIYDLEIERLTADPGQIRNAWLFGTPLFKFVTLDGSNVITSASGKKLVDFSIGCLITIRHESGDRAVIHPSINDQLTDLIKGDNRIPDVDVTMLSVEHLPLFAAWQRKIDRIKKLVEEDNQEELAKELQAIPELP
jgi:hypothetical protein